MKTEQEQIEEMAKEMYLNCFCSHDHCETCHFVKKCNQNHFAKNAYNMSYRKASDVIDGFVERLLDRFAKTETIANCLHGRTNTEIDSIIKIVAAEMRKEFRK